MASPVVKAGFWYCKQSHQSISHIDAPMYFTHLFCCYADICSSTYEVTIPNHLRETFGNFTEAAKEKNSKIITLMSIGGVDSNPSTFASMFSSPETRGAFIRSSIKQARDNNFDGLHLSWPCWKYSPTSDTMKDLGYFLDEWRTQVNGDPMKISKQQLLLSATVSYKPNIIIEDAQDPVVVSYPTDAIINLDWITVRAYDFYNPKSQPTQTRPPAALHNGDAETDPSFQSVDASIEDWIQVVPANKLVIGLPFVGYEWLLDNNRDHGIFAPAKGSPPGNGDGHIFYRNIREFITSSDFITQFNEAYGTDYCYQNSGNKWIGYDNERSITKKVDYFKRKMLRGYFAWHVCADDSQWTLSRKAFNGWRG